MQFIVGQRNAAGRPGASQSDHVLRSNVRGKDRSADDPPTEIASRKKVVCSRVFALLDHPPSHSEQNGKVDRDYEPVDSGDLGCGRSSR